MESRQLAYFLAACQHRNHAAAARLLGIAPSTLSTSLALLEEELGLELFRRTREGSYPTREARWLHRSAENIVGAITRAQNYFASQSSDPLRRVSVNVSVQLVLGRLSKALSSALHTVQNAHPEVFFDVGFGNTISANTDIADLTICYRSGRDPEGAQDVTLLQDEWVVASNTELCGRTDGAVLPAAALEGLNLSLPRLPEVLLDLADDYRQSLGLKPLPYSDEDAGALSRMSQEAQQFAFLLPASSLSDRLGERQINVYRLPRPFVSKLVAIPHRDDPALKALANELCAKIRQPEEDRIYAPQLTLRQVHYYNSVCESGNITRAAQRLRVAQPALSSQIHKIEKALSCQLFERKASGMELTEKGRTLRLITEAIGKDLSQLHHDIADGLNLRAKRMRIGVIPLTDFRGVVVKALTNALREWQTMHPMIGLQLLEGPTDIIRDWLTDGQVNFGVVENPPDYGGRLAIGTPEPLGLIVSENSIHAGRGPIEARALAQIPMILPTAVFGLRSLIVGALNGELAVKPAIEVNSLATTLAMVVQGDYATVLPRSAMPQGAEASGLIFRAIVEPTIERRLYATFSNERELTASERDFIRILRRNLVHGTDDDEAAAEIR